VAALAVSLSLALHPVARNAERVRQVFVGDVPPAKRAALMPPGSDGGRSVLSTSPRHATLLGWRRARAKACR
jgi:hypothetical protein